MLNKTQDFIEADLPMKIYVGGLTEHLADISEEDLRSIFNFGEIDYIDLNKDPMTGKTRGYAYIQFRRSSQAKAAIAAMNGFIHKGKTLKVGEATSDGKGAEMSLRSSEYEDTNIQSRQMISQKLNKEQLAYSGDHGSNYYIN